jgi:hypothetical protein
LLRDVASVNFKPFYSKFVLTDVNHQNISDMLIIEIASGGKPVITFNELEKYNIPAPPNGFSSEINSSVAMRFDDEQQAIDYAHDLDVYADSVHLNSPEYRIISDITKAISDDSFVQAYIQE